MSYNTIFKMECQSLGLSKKSEIHICLCTLVNKNKQIDRYKIRNMQDFVQFLDY